jgi:hypothetical protein
MTLSVCLCLSFAFSFIGCHTQPILWCPSQWLCTFELRKELKADQIAHKVEMAKINNLAGQNRDMLIQRLEEIFGVCPATQLVNRHIGLVIHPKYEPPR